MKRIISIVMILGLLTMAFCSCKLSGPTVISSDGNSYNLVTDKDGQRVSDADGNLIVAETDVDGNSVTKVLEDNYLVVIDDEVIAPAYEFEIPEDFEIKSSGIDPLLENKQGTIQQNITDKTQFVTDFDDYVDDTFDAYKNVGETSEEIETVEINGYEFKRFSINMQDDEGTPITAYCYFVKTENGKTLLITLTSKDGGLNSVSDADNYVANINLN